MTDWSEPLILIGKHQQEMLHLLNEKKYEQALELTFAIDAENAKLRNACWREIKP